MEPDPPTGTEMAVLGLADRAAIDRWLDRTLTGMLGAGLEQVLFRSGRIDAVYGLATAAGDQVVVKVHRPPADAEARRLAFRVQQLLADDGFPCARPVAGPTEVDGRLVSVETLLPAGRSESGHDPRIRRAVAEGLARQVDLLAGRPDLIDRIGRPPAWCDYAAGAWGRTHDPYFDFTTTPADYRWLQEFAQQASATLTTAARTGPRVAAHADWYCGNLRFADGVLVAAYDWDLLADHEAVVAGLVAATFTAGTAMGGPPTPEEAAAFLHDYETARGARFSAVDRAVAGAAAKWNIAYSARCDVTNLGGRTPVPNSALGLLQRRRADYDALFA